MATPAVIPVSVFQPVITGAVIVAIGGHRPRLDIVLQGMSNHPRATGLPAMSNRRPHIARQGKDLRATVLDDRLNTDHRRPGHPSTVHSHGLSPDQVEEVEDGAKLIHFNTTTT